MGQAIRGRLARVKTHAGVCALAQNERDRGEIVQEAIEKKEKRKKEKYGGRTDVGFKNDRDARRVTR